MQEILDSEEDTNYEFFVDFFISQLDSWFNANIKCCDNCYENFVENWPIALERINHSYCIDVLTFYSGSKLRNMYTQDEYLKNIYRVKCPRCGTSLKNNFWAFEFDFEDFNELEYDFHLLKENIKETPLIVLKNDLANKTFNLLESFSKTVELTSIDFPLYRGRTIDSEEIQKADFLAPPKILTNEGRYNHLGVPVIYAADKEITCFNELRRPKENLYVAEFVIEKDLKLLDLNNLDDDENNNLLKAIVMSSLASSKADDNSKYKPEYYFTRFISDCCKYLGFDGIIYPSVQIGVGENYVLFDLNLLTNDKIKSFRKYS